MCNLTGDVFSCIFISATVLPPTPIVKESSMTAAEINAKNEAQRNAHLDRMRKPVRTQWMGRNPVRGDAGHDANGHRSAGGAASN
jgi:hypothetical protein